MTRAGRPTGPANDTTTVVLTAALQLLLDEGANALTPQRLHQATGISRSTIYRHWPTPPDVLAALIDVASSPERILSTDPISDVHAEVDALCDRLRDKPVAAFLQALVGMQSTSAAGLGTDTLRLRYVSDLISPFRRALRSTEISENMIDDAIAAIVAPILVDALLVDRPIERDRAHRTVDLYLGGHRHSPGT